MTKQEAIEQGAKYYCPGCSTAYTYIPKYWDDRASCSGAYFTQCKHCDCDIILDIKTDSIARV